LQWDAEDPLNRDKWSGELGCNLSIVERTEAAVIGVVQHGMIKHLDPPYVYHVFKGDRDGFVKAIKDAVSHPIERWDAHFETAPRY
jgi:hypothetical protein